MRNHVEVPQQGTVKCPGSLVQLRPRHRLDQLLDQSVDDRVTDAGQVAATWRCRSTTAPVVALFVARRLTLAPYGDQHIEIELTEAIDVLALIYQADVGFDPQALEVAHVG